MRVLRSLATLLLLPAPVVLAQSAFDQLKNYTSSSPEAPKSVADAAKGKPPATAGKVAVPTGPPDIAGIRLGVPLRDAYTILQTAHPNAKLGLYPYTLPGIQKPVLEGFSFGVGTQEELVIVDVTPPPQQQVVWKVRRQLERQKIYQANAVASLREKYGKEVGTTPSPADDAHITEMWWIFDEQGRPARLPDSGPKGLELLAGCASALVDSNQPGGSWFAPSNLERSLATLDRWDGCNSAGVGVHASFRSYSNPEVVNILRVEMFNVPIAARSAKAELLFVNEAVKRQQQQEVNQSKQARPSL